MQKGKPLNVETNKDAAKNSQELESFNATLCPIIKNKRTDDDHFKWSYFHLVLLKCRYVNTRNLQ